MSALQTLMQPNEIGREKISQLEANKFFTYLQKKVRASSLHYFDLLLAVQAQKR